MKKKFILEFEKGLDPKYKQWTKEATEKFISYFPEFKDSFEVVEGKSFFTKAEILKIISRSQKNEPNIDVNAIWNEYELQSDGTYLQKGASIDWLIREASVNGKVDLRKWSELKKDGKTTVDIKDPIRISIAARDTTFAYGIGNILGPCLSAAACATLNSSDEEAYFKDIVMHELGHTFNATHEQRNNVVENLGSHCTDKDCLMYEYAYTPQSFNQRQALKQDNPFCDDCMESMRDFMENSLRLQKKNANDNHLDSIALSDLAFFKNAHPSMLAAIDTYEKILVENNIQREPKDRFFDMMSIYTSSLSTQNGDPKLRGHVIGENKFLLATAKTDWSQASALHILQGKIYTAKRFVTYSPPFDIDEPTNQQKVADIETAQMQQGSLARVKDEGYWIRKYGQGYFDNIKKDPHKEVHRFILNVNPTPELFQKLDAFSEKYGCQYKFPHIESWNMRIDPVVMYTSDDRVNEQIKELIAIASPNVRTEMMTNDLDGQRLADGIFMAKERDKKDILALAQKAENNLPELATYLRTVAQDTRNHPLSLGEFLSYEEIIDTAIEAGKNDYNYKAPEIDFDKPTIRSIRQIYYELKPINPKMAEQLEKLVEAFEAKNGCMDHAAIANDPQYQTIYGEFKKLQKNKPVIKVNDTKSQDVPDNDPSFKKAYREVFEPAARKEGSTYVENLKAKSYQAQIKKADGTIDNIEATSATNVSISSVNKDGAAQVPGMERFENIVAYANKKNARVAFGDIKTPEFMARLMIACLEATPPAKMRGQPKLDKEFLTQIEETTKTRLQAALKKVQPQQQQDDANNPLAPAPAPQTSYQQSCEARIKLLEGKEKLGKITKQEKAELDFAKKFVNAVTEQAAAEARLGINPRDIEHQQKSGLAPENYYYSTKTHKDCAAWKLHLDIVPNRNDPTTKAISEYLEALDIEHKIYHGGENGKSMTIYVGNIEDTKKLCKELNQRFGKDIEKSPAYVDQALSEHYFNDKVSGRFYLQGIFETQYPRGSVAGICPSRYGSAIDSNSECFLFAVLQKDGLIPAGESTGKYFNGYGTEDFHKHYEFHNIETYCAHKLYEKEMGEFYNGKNPLKYEQEMFGEKLPQAGTPERTKLDELANKYITFMEKQNPQLIQKMKNLATAYKPIDFPKAPAIGQPQPQNPGGRS